LDIQVDSNMGKPPPFLSSACDSFEIASVLTSDQKKAYLRLVILNENTITFSQLTSSPVVFMDILLKFLFEVWAVLCQMAPYLLFGFLCAGLLSVLISEEKVEKHLGGKGFMPVLKATLLGIPLPLCSCGVIPVFASLRKKGAGKGAATGFLISTPQTGIDSILVTYSMLGPVFAIFRPLAAFVSGIFGGMLVDFFDKESKKCSTGILPVSADKDENLEESTCCCLEKKETCCEKEDRRSGILKRIFTYGFVTLMDDIAKSLMIGIFLAAAISLVFPENWFATMAIGTGLTGMLVMMLFGIPFYVCATASVPIAAVLIAKGVSPGAAFVFLMSGPATNSAAIAIVWSLIGRRSALIYLGSLMVSALAFGLILNKINMQTSGALSEACHHETGATMYEQVSAVVLIVLLVVSLGRRCLKWGNTDIPVCD
jgi:uncharacterized membrane protein YraQ (UPF0718 family)